MQSFDFVNPSPLLAPFVKHYWGLKSDIPHVSERITPIGCIQLVFHRGDKMFSFTEGEMQPLAFIGGQSKGFIDIQSTGKLDMLVVLFHSHGAQAFFHVPMSEFYGKNVSVEDLNDKGLMELAEQVRNTSDNYAAIRLIEKFLLSRLKDQKIYNYKRIGQVMNTINYSHQPDVKKLADIACLGDKQFRRIFTQYVGTTPKEFTRVIRFQRAVFMLQNNHRKDQVELALDCGYYDQPHLIREFKEFSGYTPNEYITIFEPYSDYFTYI